MENSGIIKISIAKTWLDSDVQLKLCDRRAVFGGLGKTPPAAGGTRVWRRNPHRSKILYLKKKYLNFRAILIKINAVEMWDRN